MYNTAQQHFFEQIINESWCLGAVNTFYQELLTSKSQELSFPGVEFKLIYKQNDKYIIV